MSRKRHSPEDEPYLLVRSVSASFPGRFEIAAHAHTVGQLLFVSSGILCVSTEDGTWMAPAGTAVFAAAGVQHKHSFLRASTFVALYVREAEDVARLPRRSRVIAVSPLCRELIRRAVTLGMLDQRHPSEAALYRLICDEIASQEPSQLELPMPENPPCRRVAEFLAAKPKDQSGHEVLARMAGLSIRTLERRFFAETGMTLGQWRQRARLLQGVRRLALGDSVKKAAVELGYRSLSAFVAAFRKGLGETPARYARAHGVFGESRK